MFRIALCDDNTPFLEYEKEIIRQHLTEKSVEFKCDTFMSGVELLKNGESIRKYDLFILDYAMNGLTGFETARKIYEIYPEAKIAFATNYYDFTREGYKYNAVRYLVKQEKTFEAELKECLDLFLKKEPKKTIFLELADRIIEVNFDDIIYLSSEKHYVRYFVKQRVSEYLCRRCSLDEAQKDLPHNFVRVHQRFIVNLRTAKTIQRYEVILENYGQEMEKIPIARSRFEDVNRKYWLGKGDGL
ncbi:MAG: response regulator transcription factor [Lachnospiraceae bacterium]|nr:response regulator transcription factor [Lachnospiraceae bacterium]